MLPATQELQGLPPAAPQVEDLALALEVGQVDRDPLDDLLLGAAVAALELEVGLLALDLRRRPDRRVRARLGGGDQRPEAAPQVAALAAVAVELLVDAGEERVVVPHHVGEAGGGALVEPLQQAGVGGDRVVELRPLAVQALEQDQVEGPLAVPEVGDRELDERPQQALRPGDGAARETAVAAAERERTVLGPQPGPVREIAGRLVEKQIDRGLVRRGGPGPYIRRGGRGRPRRCVVGTGLRQAAATPRAPPRP